MKAIIVGGGFAGLAAGNRLRKAGWEVVLLEAEAQVGGRASSLRQNGYVMERGATQMSTGWTDLMGLVDEYGLKDELAASSNVIMIPRAGRRYEIDAQRPVAAAFSGLISLRSKIRMIQAVRDFLAIRPRPDVLDLSRLHAMDIESARDYAERRLNPEIYVALVEPLIRAYIINGIDEISVIEWYSVIANCNGKTFYAMRGGSDRLPRAIAETLDTRTRCHVRSVARAGAGVVVEYDDDGGREHRLTADSCVVATQLPDAVRIAPEIAAAASPLSGRLGYNRNFAVQLGYSRLPNTQALGVLFSSEDSPYITHFWMEHSKRSGAAPAGHALISVHLDDTRRDALAPSDTASLIAYCQQALETFFPELAGFNDLCVPTEWVRAIPQPKTGTYQAIHEMLLLLDPADPIQLAGDYFTCTGQNSAVHWGTRAAANILKAAAGRRGAAVSGRMDGSSLIP